MRYLSTTGNWEVFSLCFESLCCLRWQEIYPHSASLHSEVRWKSWSGLVSTCGGITSHFWFFHSTETGATKLQEKRCLLYSFTTDALWVNFLLLWLSELHLLSDWSSRFVRSSGVTWNCYPRQLIYRQSPSSPHSSSSFLGNLKGPLWASWPAPILGGPR